MIRVVFMHKKMSRDQVLQGVETPKKIKNTRWVKEFGYIITKKKKKNYKMCVVYVLVLLFLYNLT